MYLPKASSPDIVIGQKAKCNLEANLFGYFECPWSRWSLTSGGSLIKIYQKTAQKKLHPIHIHKSQISYS